VGSVSVGAGCQAWMGEAEWAGNTCAVCGVAVMGGRGWPCIHQQGRWKVGECCAGKEKKNTFICKLVCTPLLPDSSHGETLTSITWFLYHLNFSHAIRDQDQIQDIKIN
jgi:hypothetical protein